MASCQSGGEVQRKRQTSGRAARYARTAAASITPVKGGRIGPAPLRSVQEPVHGEGRDHLRVVPCAAPPVATGRLPDVLLQEGDQHHQLMRTLAQLLMLLRQS
jgi:hypothetical protein